ncbi:hypothetical protein M413DRAFT_139896 [Hebeloma cylindrosporum]|uniref:Uncharacterized protein n=1 Tax=Hebeloma cylindrosporum TaxID=76867 RepID=A0A0C2XW36_HEBCY|nr:hypothetical protein M413DRAFT_139896 [Hebeloma cylindrosporum h7]
MRSLFLFPFFFSRESCYLKSSGHSSRLRHRPSASNLGLTGYDSPSPPLRPTGTKGRKGKDKVSCHCQTRMGSIEILSAGMPTCDHNENAFHPRI